VGLVVLIMGIGYMLIARRWLSAVETSQDKQR